MVKEITLDFGALTTICGTRLRQPLGSLYAKEWSLFVSDSPVHGWTKWIEAVDPNTASGQAVSDGRCSTVSSRLPRPWPHAVHSLCIAETYFSTAGSNARACQAQIQTVRFLNLAQEPMLLEE